MLSPYFQLNAHQGKIHRSGDFICWTIDNFFSLPEADGFLSMQSPLFVTDGEKEVWKLRVHFSGSADCGRKMIIELIPVTCYAAMFNIHLGLSGEQGKEIAKQWQKFLFMFNNPNPTLEFNYREYLSRRCRSMPHCQLFVFVNITEITERSVNLYRPLFETAHRSAAEIVETPRAQSVSKLYADMKSLLESGKDTDVVLKVSGKDFRAHQVILKMRSPVFAAMFEHDLIEKQSGVVIVEDGDPDTFFDLLLYIYTGDVELTSDNYLSLYRAADVYQLPLLKKECVEYMKRNLTVENACDIFGLSHLHGERELSSKACFYFRLYADQQTNRSNKLKSKNLPAANELRRRQAKLKIRLNSMQRDLDKLSIQPFNAAKI